MGDQTNGWVFLRSTVEHPGGLDEEWAAIPRADWDAMTDKERDNALVEYAVTHQNNVAPCGAQIVDAADAPDEVTTDPDGHRW